MILAGVFESILLHQNRILPYNVGVTEILTKQETTFLAQKVSAKVGKLRPGETGRGDGRQTYVTQATTATRRTKRQQNVLLLLRWRHERSY